MIISNRVCYSRKQKKIHGRKKYMLTHAFIVSFQDQYNFPVREENKSSSAKMKLVFFNAGVGIILACALYIGNENGCNTGNGDGKFKFNNNRKRPCDDTGKTNEHLKKHTAKITKHAHQNETTSDELTKG